MRATWLQNNLLNILRSIDIETESIPLNFVYLHPTIGSLSRYLSGVACGHHSDPTEGILELMNHLAKKYSTGFLQHKARLSDAPVSETILLTGSTGGLGSYILEHLVLDNTVSKIYCLNRKGQVGSLERQKAAFMKRGINNAVLNSDKLVFLEGEVDHPYLGLLEQQYEEVRESITCVLHVGEYPLAISSSLW